MLQLLRNTRLELAFASAHLPAQNFRISNQCKLFPFCLDFQMFVESVLLWVFTSSIYIFVLFFFLISLKYAQKQR